MLRARYPGLVLGLLALFAAHAGCAQTGQDEVVNAPDQLAWALFLQVNTDAKTTGNNNALFETWASGGDTFQPAPAWPTRPAPPLVVKIRRSNPAIPPGNRAKTGWAAGTFRLILSTRATPYPRALALARHPPGASGGLLPQVVPGGLPTEETRRNRPDFDFITQKGLYKVVGLIAAFQAGKTLRFPGDSIEIKANWVDVGALKAFNGFNGTPADAAKSYHVNSAGRKQLALVSMYIISKLVPNWTWATFEHKDNPGRCDVTGCRDAYGTTVPFIAPLSVGKSTLGGGKPTHYPDYTKTDALDTLFRAARIDPAYKNHSLKGSQTDFTDPTGLPIRVGNSVTEQGFVAHASCMSCHGRAAFGKDGHATTFAGFNPIDVGGDGPIGPIDPGYFFTPTVSLVRFDTELARYALAADFVWSVPFSAIDDIATPPQKKSRFCAAK